MPLYAYHCSNCDARLERLVLMDERHSQSCELCGSPLDKQDAPDPHYKPFHNYFDEGLGVAITGRDHRRRVMREMKCDYRDHMSKGDQSARIDRAQAAKAERSR